MWFAMVGNMNDQNAQHATITLERTYRAPLSRVFAEFADPVVRARWSPPANDVLIYDEADFRMGGRDVFRCGPQNDPRFRGETLYHVIVPNKLVISSETLDTDNRRLGVSLTTLDFEESQDGSKLKMTVQMVSLAGPGMIEGFESGYRSALENLSRHLIATAGESRRMER
jgi:uncharacterized protein YndB with AHSA1/START domain